MVNLNWVPLVCAAAAAVPSGAIFFVAYGRYNGAFRDNVVFLHFMFGLVMGGFLGAASFVLFRIDAPLLQVLGVALLFPIAVVAVINRRKWQGERHAVFNGGAAGLGAAVMVSFSLLYAQLAPPQMLAQAAADDALRAATGIKDARAPPVDSVPFAFDPDILPQGILMAVALALLLFGLGLLAGNAVRVRKQLRIALLGTAIMIAPAVFLEEFLKTRVWLLGALLVAYGAVFAVLAERKLLIEGVEPEMRKQRRRRQRSTL